MLQSDKILLVSDVFKNQVKEDNTLYTVSLCLYVVDPAIFPGAETSQVKSGNMKYFKTRTMGNNPVRFCSRFLPVKGSFFLSTVTRFCSNMAFNYSLVLTYYLFIFYVLHRHITTHQEWFPV